jgi:hypothetical protein
MKEAKMDVKRPAVERDSGTARRSRWVYWVIVPICALTYALYCTWFLLEAWGRRGEPKPAWFEIAAVPAWPGMFCFPIPFVGPLVFGAGVGFILTWSIRQVLERAR